MGGACAKRSRDAAPQGNVVANDEAVGLTTAPEVREEIWFERNCLDLCAEGEEAVFEGKVNLLPRSQASTLRAAVEQLNSGDVVCSAGFCAVHSATRGRYYLLWAEGMKEAATAAVPMELAVNSKDAAEGRTIQEQNPASSSTAGSTLKDEEFFITICKTDETSLGAQCEAAEGCLIIHNLMESGLIADWNKENIELTVKAGDRILEVNGGGGSAEALIAELKKSQELVISLRRVRPGESVVDSPSSSSGYPSRALDSAQPVASKGNASSSSNSTQRQGPMQAAATKKKFEQVRGSHIVPGGEVRLSMKSGNDANANVKDMIELEITLDKTHGASLGVAAKPVPSEGILVVETINSDGNGLVSEWNAANPEYRVELGDRIVEINGVSGNANGLVAQCRENKPLRMKLLRDATPEM